jgi:hypothetical protein
MRQVRSLQIQPLPDTCAYRDVMPNAYASVQECVIPNSLFPHDLPLMIVIPNSLFPHDLPLMIVIPNSFAGGGRERDLTRCLGYRGHRRDRLG